MAQKRKRSASADSDVQSGDEDEEEDRGPISSGAGQTLRSAAYSISRPTGEDITPLLNCSACIDPLNPRSTRRLFQPTTLPCGHTVCNSHIPNLPPLDSEPEDSTMPHSRGCPIPNCSNGVTTPHVPPLHPNTAVRCYPFLGRTAPPSTFIPRDLKFDVKISKLLGLVGEETMDTAQEDRSTTPIEVSPDTSRRAGKMLRFSISNIPEVLRKDLLEVLTCEVCLMLLYEPLTSPCGHTFCTTCLQRTLDTHSKCPLCRSEFSNAFKAIIHASDMRSAKQPLNQVLLGIIMLVFSKEYLGRKAAIEREIAHLATSRLNTPIRVSELVLPGCKALVSFSQPRERAMLRSILAAQHSTFGVMVPPEGVTPQASGIAHSYGTLVEIKSIQAYPDFRSVAQVEGISRFRVIESSLHDGYVVARVESIDDYPTPDLSILSHFEGRTELPRPRSNVESDLPVASGSTASSSTSNLPEHSRLTVAEIRDTCPKDDLYQICHEFVDRLRADAAPFVIRQANQDYGDQPTDPVMFVWWVASLLPHSQNEKSRLLAIRSPILRLRLVCHWITKWHDQWWYNEGCIIS